MEYYIVMKINELKHHRTIQINFTTDIEQKEKKRDTKEYILYDSIHIKIKNKPV